MIDLSFLTEEEQETILAVLKRDADLKKAEEKRIKNLQKSVSSKGRLKYLTGDWFYETKSLRHQEHIHGSDIIRASMRHTRKPLTILELSQMLPERPSFVSSSNQEVFIPPQLSGLIQEPHMQLSNEKNQNWNPFVKPQEIPVSQSPSKQRQNPFNSEPLAPLEENDSQLVDGPAEQTLTPDLCEHCDTELLSPQVSNPFLAEQEPGKPVHVETEREEDGLSKAKATDWLTGHSIHQPQPKLPEQSSDNLNIFVEATSHTKPSSNDSSKNSSHAVSPKPRKGLLGIFSRGESKEKTAELQSPHKEEVKLSKQKELDDTLNRHSSRLAANITKDNQINFACVKQEAKTPGTTEFRTLQVTALQNNPIIQTMTSLGSDLDTQQEPTEGEDRDTKFPRRLSNLKASWERGNSDPKVSFTREQARHEDSPKTKTEDLHGPQNDQIHSTLESKIQMELTEECRTKDNVAQSHEEIPSPQIESSILLDLPEEDGTYRANPILISEETDDSLTGSITDSQIPEPQENVTTPLPISLSCNIPQQKGNKPVPLPRQSCLQENRPTVINEEYSGTRVIVGRVTEASSSPIHSSSNSGQTMHHNNKVVTSHSDLRTTLSSREKSEEEVQHSSHSTKSNVVSNTKHVTDKGFVSHSSDKSQLRSSGIPRNVGSTYQQHQLKTEIESVLPQERHLSPSKVQTPRAKDSTDDEVRRSPSKTCHPKALPREPTSPKGSSLEGSPLKTFPIDLAPPTKAHEEQPGRPTPAARQRKSPLHEAQLSGLMDIKPSTEIITRSLLLQPEDGEQHHLTLSLSEDPVQSLTHSARRSKFGNVNTQQSSQSSTTGLQSRTTSESANIGPALTKINFGEQLPGSSKKLGTVTHLARSVIPRGYQHYLGAPEKTHLPPFHQEKVDEESNVKPLAPSSAPVAVHRPQSPLTEFEGNQGNSTTERNHSRISSWIVQNTDNNSSQDRTTGAWSQSRASSGSELLNSLFTYVSFRYDLEMENPVMVLIVEANHANCINGISRL